MNELEQHKGRLNREKEENRKTESQITQEERSLTKIRESLVLHEEEKASLEGEVAILRN